MSSNALNVEGAVHELCLCPAHCNLPPVKTKALTCSSYRRWPAPSYIRCTRRVARRPLLTPTKTSWSLFTFCGPTALLDVALVATGREPSLPKGVFLFVTTQRVKPYSTLPATMTFLDIYKHFQPSRFHGEFVLDQLPSWIAMYTAIEMALHKPLDHNAELQTVGWSNVSGVDSRLTGVLVFALELVLVVTDYFASLQTFIAIDLTMEWMVHYANLWFTFVIMDVLNLEAGIVLGTIDARLASASCRGNAIFTFELLSCNIETGLSCSMHIRIQVQTHTIVLPHSSSTVG
ncbi:hypothetical protein H257_07209 [Aphanomyces astaci]|uniref:Uncharacterized protein n=1 Tax=Aphanomyces astaci TaxID=112090 RepID=W4GK13_APHAT|nr:hypothetical protein H257_07209 [Aphanomyces astaci]ETV80025.1 hypothetical protein H257_07209 [Aphanomyces astaci]|eukprot:XP_009830961.1 hypothetical protein H257_07209 [Aphanomyces astaci]